MCIRDRAGPVKGDVQEYHRECPPALPRISGSPDCSDAFTLASRTDTLRPLKTSGAENESLSGVVLIARTVWPLWLPWPWTLIW